MTAPVDNLVRARYDDGTVALRSADDGGTGRTMHGHFAVHDQWTRIDSWYEGTFLERIAKGSFKQTFKDNAGQIRVLYEHGRDPSVGNKPLGAPSVMREDSEGAYYECELFDAGYVNDLMPAIRSGQMGASFRFTVEEETMNHPKKASDHNPEMLPERTIKRVNLFEFGPCPFPAYAGATAGLRSETDAFLESFMDDPAFVARFTEHHSIKVTEKILASLPPHGRSGAPASEVPTHGGSEQAQRPNISLAVARARFVLTTTP